MGGCKLEKGQQRQDDDRERRVCRIRLFPRHVGETGPRCRRKVSPRVPFSVRDDQRYVIVTLIGGRTVKMATDDGGSTTIVDERTRKSPNSCVSTTRGSHERKHQRGNRVSSCNRPERTETDGCNSPPRIMARRGRNRITVLSVDITDRIIKNSCWVYITRDRQRANYCTRAASPSDWPIGSGRGTRDSQWQLRVPPRVCVKPVNQ